MTPARRWALVAAALFLGIFAGAARADTLRPGYIQLAERAPGQWDVVFRAPVMGGMTPATRVELPAGCTAQGPVARTFDRGAQDAGSVVSTWSAACPRGVAGGRIGLAGFETSRTDVLVRISALGRPVEALRLTAAAPSVEIPARPGRWQVALTYLGAGTAHILAGYDHVLFVVALVLLLGGGWRVAQAVTAFTLAHSITLAGTTLGAFSLPQRPVEAVIALSIVFLAVEVVKRDPAAPRLSERIPWAVAFVFGLLHGFGLAGALRELGLPQGEVPMALLSFNLGVEAGQLAIVAVTLAILALVRRLREPAPRLATTGGAYAIGIVASAWLFARTLG
ncbi:HupE/UreJ family protein [Novosphingobium tardum]|uniref:HupE/UreJ family protein n=1 Tax=Novosphingobium tardum TaxID=1538021 RepID=A0ABV8RTA9_9SPHN